MCLPTPTPRSCPACSHTASTLIFPHPLAAISGISLHAGYEVVACQRCGMVYAQNIPDQPAFDHYYEACSRYEDSPRGGKPSAVDQARFNAIAEGLSTHLPQKDIGILEIGCSTGGLLGELRSRGFSHLEGVDPSPQCGISTHDQYGVKAHQGTLFTPIPRGPWDMIIVVGVLEHVREFGMAVQNLRAGLKDGGLIYLEVPDLEGFYKTNEAPYQEFSTEHINFFTTTSLDTAMGNLGFERAFGEIVQRTHSGGSTMQVIAFAYRKIPISAHPINPDLKGPEAARHYAELCFKQSEPERIQAHELATSGTPIAIWGAGTVACRLLATTDLAKAAIQGFVDSNPHLQGCTIAGHVIHPPKWLKAFDGTIFIASRGYASEIAHTIRQNLGLKNPVVFLRGKDSKQ